MFDRPAAIAAARKLLDDAPTLDGSDAPIFDVGELVDAVIAAANPDALVIPTYDTVGAPTANYPVLYPTHNGVPLPGSTFLGVYASDVVLNYGDVVDVGMVEHTVRTVHADQVEVLKLMLRADGAWHFHLAGLAAAVEAKKMREVKG